MSRYPILAAALAVLTAPLQAALPPDYDPLDPRGPTNCLTYDWAQQDRDAYFFGGGSVPTAVLEWAVPARQNPLAALYEVRHAVSAGDDDFYATISATRPDRSGTGWREFAWNGGFTATASPLKLDGKSIIGYVEGKCQPGTARLTRFYSRTYGTHYYTLDGTLPGTTRAPADANWTPEEAYEGYVWTSRIPESEPLKRCHYRLNGKYSSRIASQSMLDAGALGSGYTCESTPIGYVMPHANTFFRNAARPETNFTQRCNDSAYRNDTNGCYPLPAGSRDQANLGGGFFQSASANPMALPVQRMSFTLNTSDFFTSNSSSHLAFGLLSSVSVTGTYQNPVVGGVHAVVLGFGAHNGCPGTNGQPTVWLEPLGAGSIIAGTCARTESLKAEPMPFIVRNGRTYNVTFEVDRVQQQARYSVTNTQSAADSVVSPWYPIGTAFGALGFPSSNTGYYGTATENPNKDFTVHVRNIQTGWFARP